MGIEVKDLTDSQHALLCTITRADYPKPNKMNGVGRTLGSLVRHGLIELRPVTEGCQCYPCRNQGERCAAYYRVTDAGLNALC